MNQIARVQALAAIALLAFGQEASAADDQVRPQPLLRFEREPCLGPCPVYTVEVDSDGTIRYEGSRFVLTVGKTSARLSPAMLEELRAVLSVAGRLSEPKANDCADFFTDSPGVNITIADGRLVKRIRDYHGCPRMKNPKKDKELKALRSIEEKIDEILETVRWVGTLAERKQCCYGRFYRR